jgi:hypothetical protein
MAVQLTASDDVRAVSVAANTDASIRWHVYERLISGSPAVYLQRELNEVLQAEQQLVPEGANPRVLFNTTSSEWILFYTLQESVFMLRYGETEIPIIIAPQVADTSISHYRLGPSDSGDSRTMGTRATEMVIGLASRDSANGPIRPDSVAVGGADTPGNIVVRWLPNSTQLTNIAGYYVYRCSALTGGVERISTLQAYNGPGVHEFETTFQQGTYYVTQVNYKGEATATIEGRILPPGDELLSTLTITEAFMDAKLGAGQALVTEVIDRAPLVVPVPTDNFPSVQVADGYHFTYSNPQVTVPLAISVPTDSYPSVMTGSGVTMAVTKTGTGTIVIG